MADGTIIIDTKIDTRGLKSGVQDMSNDVNSKFAGMSDGFSKTGAKLTNYITKPALIAGGALASMTIGKGMSRLAAIDEAKAKLSALGHDARSVQEIMNNATDAVRGTAFGLDEAATTSAAAVAAGIQPGQELTRYLKLCGDAAAVAGVDFEEMGSIFNRVAANGKVGTDELNQLADRGIPVWQLLAQETGMSMDELRQAVSDGTIDINTFQNAIERMGKGEAGELAKEMGSSTLSGSIKNLGAAIGRIGANFLSAGDDAEGVFDKLQGLVIKLTDWLSAHEEDAKRWGATLGSIFGKVLDFVMKIPPGLLASIFGFAVSAGPLLKFVGAMMKAKEAMLMFQTANAGMSVAMGLFTGKIGPATLMLSKLAGGFQFLLGPVGLVIAAIAAAIAIGILIYKHWDEIKVWLIAIWEAIKDAAVTIWNAIKEVILAVWEAIKTAAVAVWDAIKWYFTTVFNIYKTIIVTVWNWIKTFLTTIWNGIKVVASTVWDGIKYVIVTPIAAARDFLSNAWTSIKNKASEAWNGIKSIASNVWNGVKNAIVSPIESAKEKIHNLIEKIKGFFKFKFELPHIKLPHFKVYPKGWKIGDLLKGSIPSLGIDWYAGGAVFKKPTLLSNGGRLSGVGEAGPEAVAPISVLQKYVFEAVSAAVAGISASIIAVAQAIADLGQAVVTLQRVDIGEAYAGVSSPAMYSADFASRGQTEALASQFGNEVANALLPMFKLINSSSNAEIHIDNYLSPNDVKLGETIVRLYDIYKKRLG